MYKTNKKEIIDLVQQKRKEGSTQVEVAEFLNKNNYKWINKHDNLAGFNNTIISGIERELIKKDPTVKYKRLRTNEDEKQIITNKIEEAINKTGVFLLPFLYSDNEKFIKRIKDIFDLDISKNKDCFTLRSQNYLIQFISKYIGKYKPEFNTIIKIQPYDKKRKKGFNVYAKSLEDIKEFERKIKDNKTPSNLQLFEDKKEIKEKSPKVNETKDKQLLALNLKLECDKLKSIEQYVAETEKEINDLNMRLDKLNQSILQYNKVRDLTKQEIEEIIQEIEEINKELSNE